ncbi:metallophosphoesterase [Methylomonas sp. LL1]|uniref:metallophosphoesterase family protein n=1 Tax=Methylomonas sp. LL1 TaxID=2785785 RepID=UPI0018C42188|nr:metallophosphoesterase [Methylomonas sp. LL1]QPK61916.1 metallophosphoesterase [Methylomonas sp. LL1]
MQTSSSLAFANWLAQIIDPMFNVATLDRGASARNMAALLLNKFIAIPNSNYVTEDFSKHLLELDLDGESPVDDEFYSKLRAMIGQKQWLAVIIPSGIDVETDKVLCDPHLLEYLLKSGLNHRGVVIALDEAPQETTAILNIHPTLRTALNEAISWPGILVGVPGGDSVFFPLSSPGGMELDIDARLIWLFSRLNGEPDIHMGKLKIAYRAEFPEVFEHESACINILHLSDFNIGSKSANFRTQRVQDFLRSLIEELGENAKTVPVVTGNLMEGPGEQHMNAVRSFWTFLAQLGVEEPLLVLGSSDVRKDGNINENYLTAIGFPMAKVIWYDAEKIGLICVNSVVQGNLTNGSVNRSQLDEIEYELARKKNAKDFKLIAILHHHPIPHQKIHPQTDLFYAQIIGTDFKPTMPLEDADLFLGFLQKNSVCMVLHGHHHIPCFSVNEQNIPVIGCGSSIGHMSNTDGSIYFSVNIITINTITEKMSCRFFAYRKPEGGIIEPKWHEILYRTTI